MASSSDSENELREDYPWRSERLIQLLGTADHESFDVTICIATFHREEQLLVLLESILAQRYRAISEPTICFSIADNSPTLTSASTIHEFCRLNPSLALVLDQATPQGVVHARNVSVRNAPPSDFVIFVDDDEYADTQWLESLLSTQRATGATGVVGPLREVLPAGVPAWYHDGGLDRPDSYPDQERIYRGYTSNMMLRASAVEDPEGPFDERFNVTGGEDTHLCIGLLADGAYFVWAADAVVSTEVPLERTELSFVLRREFVGAANFTRSERLVHGVKVIPKRVLTGSARGAMGLVVAAGAMALGRKGSAAQAIAHSAKGLGVLAGAVGFRRIPSWW